MSSHFKGTLFKTWNFQQFKTAANSMLESEGDRSLDAAEDAGRPPPGPVDCRCFPIFGGRYPGCFRAIPVGLAHGFAACFASYWRSHATHRSSKCHNCAGPRITPVLACPGGKDLHSPNFFDKLTGRHPPGWRPVRILFFQPVALTPAQMLRYTAGSTRPSGRSGPHGCRAR